MAGNGGKREGAGRKPGSRGQNTKLAEALKQGFILRYTKRKFKIWDALLDRAEQGDIPAIKEANERGMGKVKDAMELTGRLTIGEVLKRINDGTTTGRQDMEDEPSLPD